MASVSPWLVLAGLGAFHGLNPAMGWLFAVSLGMQDGDRRSVKRAPSAGATSSLSMECR